MEAHSLGSYVNEYMIGGAAFIIMLSILVSRALGRFAIPSLAVFLGIGMLAGSEGLGGITFDNAWVAQFIGLLALAIIIFSGGFHTEWKEIRPLLKEGAALATVSVILTAIMIGAFAAYWIDIPIIGGMLLGAIVSSTDAAAVFSVLRSRNVNMRKDIRALLEFESASNDPMAVLLTIGVIEYIMSRHVGHNLFVLVMAQQIAVGLVVGYAFARATVFLLERIRLDYKGLYPVLLLSLVCITYALTDVLGGSGFLAVYVMGVTMGHRRFLHRALLQDFFEGLAWLSQIAMFVIMGLLVFPSRLATIWQHGLVIAAFIMFVARPASTMITLAPFRMGWRERVLISWTGLRGSVPILLATFPIVAGVPHADKIFDTVFFVVLISILVQGITIPPFARMLGLTEETAAETKTIA